MDLVVLEFDFLHFKWGEFLALWWDKSALIFYRFKISTLKCVNMHFNAIINT